MIFLNMMVCGMQGLKNAVTAPQFQGWSKATAVRRGEAMEELQPLAKNPLGESPYARLTKEEAVQLVEQIQDEVHRLERYNNMPGTHNLHVVLPSESTQIREIETKLLYVARLAPLDVVDAMDRAIETVQGYTFSEELAKRIEARLYRTTITRLSV